MEQRLNILKAMSEVTGHMDMKHFAQTVGLTPSETIEQVQQLAKAGFVKKSGSGYGITDKGKNALKAVTPVPADKAFQFYNGIDQPTGLYAENVKEFYDAVMKVDVASLEFHFYRGDFENWIRTLVNDAEFADELAKMKKSELKGENLRKEISQAAEERYSIEP
jgi:predicted transcriptional regulator